VFKRRALGMLAAIAAFAGATPVIANTITYNFNDGTLQGWSNRVWDLAANGGSGGWVNLPPNVSAMPGSINGGALQPPSGENGMFSPANNAVWVNGQTDNHLNTLWLSSPEFYLDGSGDLTAQLNHGIANAPNPASESAIPFAAVTGGGWKGVVLRRSSDGAFLLTKPRTGANGGEWRTVTFSAAELAPYVGVKCTLDLINSDRGGWGWIVMDNVSIPGVDIEPPAPTAVAVTAGANRLVLSWTAAPRATGYKVLRSTVSGSGYVEVANTATLSFTDTTVAIGTPYYYVVRGTNLGGDGPVSAPEATGTATGGTADSAKELLTLSFGGLGNAVISGTTINKYLPAGTNLSALAPTYTTSLFATGSPASATSRDFRFPQTYTITAEDGSTKNYTVTVTLVSPITYDFTGGLQNWEQLFPTGGGVLWENSVNSNGGALGSGHDGGETRFARSPAFYLLDSGPLTFTLQGGQSPLAAPAVGPAAIPELAIDGGGFAGVALRDVATNTYVLSRRRTGNGDEAQLNQFTAAELVPFANDGKQYTLDYIDYNKGGWGWTYMDNVSIPGVSQEPGTEALLTLFSITPHGVTEIDGTNITVWLPAGTNVTALNPVIAVSPEATLSPPAGTPRNFTTSQTYTVTSGDTLATETYTVTVIAAGSLSVKTYDTLEGPAFLAPISNLQAAPVTATGIQINEIFYGNFVAGLPGLTSPESFSVLWEGWFNVGLDGPGAYTFGTQSDDGSMIYLDLNDDGDFNDAGELIVDNNGFHGYDIRTGSVNLPMDAVRIAIGFFESGGGEGMDARFQQGNGVAFGSLQRIGGKSGHFTIERPVANPASAALWNLAFAGNTAKAKGTQLFLSLPTGTDLTTVAPTFLLSPGATSVPPSGTPRNFTTPQTYTVTSQDLSTTTVYTVTARTIGALNVKTYDTVSGTGNLAPLSNLQGLTPSASFAAPNDISFAAFDPAIPGLTGPDTFSVLWEGWLNVAADGPGFYSFGTRSDDGSMIYLDLNNDGDFGDPGELIVSNNQLQPPTTVTNTVWLPMDSVRIAIAYFEEGGGETMEARYGKGQGLAYADMDLIGGAIGTFTTTPPAAKPGSAALWYLTYLDNLATGSGTNLLLAVPEETDITTLDPDFLISPGASSVPPSGTPRNFTTPQTYTVTSQDTSTTTVYTVTVYRTLKYDFNNATLQGWRNRVWDLAANSRRLDRTGAQRDQPSVPRQRRRAAATVGRQRDLRPAQQPGAGERRHRRPPQHPVAALPGVLPRRGGRPDGRSGNGNRQSAGSGERVGDLPRGDARRWLERRGAPPQQRRCLPAGETADRCRRGCLPDHHLHQGRTGTLRRRGLHLGSDQLRPRQLGLAGHGQRRHSDDRSGAALALRRMAGQLSRPGWLRGRSEWRWRPGWQEQPRGIRLQYQSGRRKIRGHRIQPGQCHRLRPAAARQQRGLCPDLRPPSRLRGPGPHLQGAVQRGLDRMADGRHPTRGDRRGLGDPSRAGPLSRHHPHLRRAQASPLRPRRDHPQLIRPRAFDPPGSSYENAAAFLRRRRRFSSRVSSATTWRAPCGPPQPRARGLGRARSTCGGACRPDRSPRSGRSGRSRCRSASGRSGCRAPRRVPARTPRHR
jgi:hypothetical protein